jgi:hypothetical protein
MAARQSPSGQEFFNDQGCFDYAALLSVPCPGRAAVETAQVETKLVATKQSENQVNTCPFL